MHIIVKAENPHDEICLQLIRDLSKELGQLYGDDGTGAFKPDDVTMARSAFVVAWVNDIAIGCGALRPMSEDTAEIKRMFVKHEYRGHGVSRQILAKLESLATEFGYTLLRLETGTKQPEEIGLYKSSGYTQTNCYAPYNAIRSVCVSRKP